MSFTLPGEQVAPSRRTTSVIAPEAQRRALAEAAQQHEQLVSELRFLAKKQTQRIDKLKLDTAVQLEHHAALRRIELEKRKSAAQEAISDITPRLEVVRQQWNHAKQQNQGFEMQWGAMRSQFQQIKQRVDTLRDKITDGRTSIEGTRKTVTEMREHLHRLERDKAAMRAKIQRALECVVIDEYYLTTRVAEEEAYRTKIADTLNSMGIEYQSAQAQHQHELVPLQEDVKLLYTYYEEMKARTSELSKYCLDLEGKLVAIEDHWLESVHQVYEALERANALDQLKNIVLSWLEQSILTHQQNNVQPRQKTGQMDAYWLSHAILVWENIVKIVSDERHNMQTRDDANMMVLAETSQRNQQTKEMLVAVKSKVEGQGTERRELLQRIVDLHFLVIEKKEAEEQMIKYIQELSTQLDEDLSQVLHLARKDGYDDYVSSTDGDEEMTTLDDDDFEPLQEDNIEDISQLCSAADLDPNDPQADDIIKRMTHRPKGHLDGFSTKRQQWLQKHSGQSGPGGDNSTIIRRSNRQLRETLERALLEVQGKVAGEVISFVRNRASSIQQGLLDPKSERIQADPRYIARSKDLNTRIERWIQTQKENPGGARGSQSNFLSVKAPNATTASGRPIASTAGAPAGQAPSRIVVEGARIPPEIARANAVDRAAYYVSMTIKGFNFMMYLRRSMAPQLRHIFLSRDLSRFVARRVGTVAQDDGEEELVLRLADVTNIVLGHKSDLFKDLRSQSRNIMREELAFSVLTSIGSSFDVECDTADDRNYWAAALAWIVNESRFGGVVSTLVRAGKIAVVDTLNRSAVNVEPRDRNVLQVQIGA